MEKEENVYEEIVRAEAADTEKEKARVRETERGAESDSTALGKFRSVDALMKAYGSLQAEFTRRSQKLKELERALENFGGREAASGAEKLRKNAALRRERAQAFDGFLAEANGGGKTTVSDSASTVAEETDASALDAQAADSANLALKPDGAESPAIAEDTVMPKGATAEETSVADGVATATAAQTGRAGEKASSLSVAKAEEAKTSSDALYEQASRDEKVRLRIVGEYLASIGRTTPPVMTGGTGVALTPPLRAKSIGDAGEMALRYFKKTSV